MEPVAEGSAKKGFTGEGAALIKGANAVDNEEGGGGIQDKGINETGGTPATKDIFEKSHILDGVTSGKVFRAGRGKAERGWIPGRFERSEPTETSEMIGTGSGELVHVASTG